MERKPNHKGTKDTKEAQRGYIKENRRDAENTEARRGGLEK